jgi:hypothetical protein
MKGREMTAREMAARRWQKMTPKQREENIQKATTAARAKRLAMPIAKRAELARKAAKARWGSSTSSKRKTENS